VVPGAVSIAATQRNSDPDVLAAAVLAGYEVMVRFGCAIGGASILYRGIWPTYFAAPLGMAATAARLLGLDAAQAAHALALALTRAAPGVGQHHAATASRWLAIGQAAEAGLMAALAARAGFTSDLALLDGGYLPGIYGVTPDLAVLTDRLGTQLAIGEVAFKPWCAARQTMAAAQAMRELVAAGIAADTIIQVKAFVPPPHRRMVDHGVKPADRGSVLTSLPYQIALAALAPKRLRGQGPLTPAQIPAGIEAFTGRVVVEPDEALLAPFPARWPARLEVTTPTGRHDITVTDVPGDPARPFDAAAVREKFHRFADAAVDAASASHLFDRTMRLLTERNAAAALVDDLEAIVLNPAA
jgi:2-methylcitrate dehydratase PrpD